MGFRRGWVFICFSIVLLFADSRATLQAKSCKRAIIAAVCVGLSAGGCMFDPHYPRQGSWPDRLDSESEFAQVDDVSLLGPTIRIEDSSAGGLKFEALKVDQQIRARNLIEEEIKKYPEHFVSARLHKIYFLNSLVSDGDEIGGVCLSSTICIKQNSYVGDDWLRQTFHHEFSHFLMGRYFQFFDQKAWNAALPPGFKYGGTKFRDKIIHEGTANDRSENLLSQGFIREYGSTDFDEDEATIAAELFYPDEGFWEVVDSHWRLRAKVEVMIKFYNTLAPQFTEDYFRSLDRSYKNSAPILQASTR